MSASTDAEIDPLDRLITDLNDADVRVAQAALERFEPFLRMVVRRQIAPGLRSKLDSMDVVQSIWADLLGAVSREDWRFRDASQLRAFLARVARNRLIDHQRKHRRAIENDRPIDSLSPAQQPREIGPRASEVVRGRELWDRLLDVCPASHREILRLKLEGRTLAEISDRCGLHAGSVRRILYDLARTMRVADPEGASAA
jgi:RNA polymerase sigma factor (sigma-70 family)